MQQKPPPIVPMAFTLEECGQLLNLIDQAVRHGGLNVVLPASTFYQKFTGAMNRAQRAMNEVPNAGTQRPSDRGAASGPVGGSTGGSEDKAGTSNPPLEGQGTT